MKTLKEKQDYQLEIIFKLHHKLDTKINFLFLFNIFLITLGFNILIFKSKINLSLLITALSLLLVCSFLLLFISLPILHNRKLNNYHNICYDLSDLNNDKEEPINKLLLKSKKIYYLKLYFFYIVDFLFVLSLLFIMLGAFL